MGQRASEEPPTVICIVGFTSYRGRRQFVARYCNKRKTMTLLKVWCDESYMCLNVTITKDTCIEFRRDPPPQTDTVIHENTVEVVDEYKHLGTTIDNKLRWDRHCRGPTVTYKKCQQRLYCLRTLDNTSLSMVCKSCIQSVLTFSFICWFGNVSQKDKNNLQRIVGLNISSKVTGVTQSTLTALYEKQVVNKATRILADDTHVLHADYILLPSSRRFRNVTCKTNRKRLSILFLCRSCF